MKSVIRTIGRTIWDSTDNTTKWIQVIALCVAAGWTFRNYSVADTPQLEPHMNVAADDLTIKDGWELNTCLAQYKITLKNEGKVSFDVKEVHFRAWHLDTPDAAPWEATFVDDEHFNRGTQIIDLPITWAPMLVRHYAPGQQAQQDFTWLLRRQKPGMTNFTVEVSVEGGKKIGYGRHWQKDVCADSAALGSPLTKIQER